MSGWVSTTFEERNDMTIDPDKQTGFAVVVQWTNPDVPGARATTTYAVVEEQGETPGEVRYAVADQVEHLIGSDPDDLPGSETFTSLVNGEGSYVYYANEDEARDEARRMAAGEVAEGTIPWDGTPYFA